MHKYIKEISLKVPAPASCLSSLSWFSHRQEFFLLIPPFASYFHHYAADATAQHPSRQLLPSEVEVAHESKSMQLNSLLWSIISNLKLSSHYLRSFMHVACEENLNSFGIIVCRRWRDLSLSVATNVYDLEITLLHSHSDDKTQLCPSRHM